MPTNAGIKKKIRQFKGREYRPDSDSYEHYYYEFDENYEYMIRKEVMVQLLKEAVRSFDGTLKMSKDAILLVSQVTEQHVIEKMAMAQANAISNGRDTVEHIV
jgi:histone H3/H4